MLARQGAIRRSCRRERCEDCSACPFCLSTSVTASSGSTANSSPWKDAKLHVLSHGLHYGSCVFEGERAYGGAIFKSREHSERFKSSARIARFRNSLFGRGTRRGQGSLSSTKNDFENCYVRPVAWRGIGNDGGFGAARDDQRRDRGVGLAVRCSTSRRKMKGIRLDIAEYRRPDPATRALPVQGGRPLHDLHDLQASRRAQAAMPMRMMLDWQGRVAECTGANIFFTRTARSTRRSPIASSTASRAAR